VIEQIEVDIQAVGPTSTEGSTTESNNEVVIYADAPSDGCGDGVPITLADEPNGNVGNVSILLTPGYTVPYGYSVASVSSGMGGYVEVSGYFVPQDEAPTSPQVGTNGKMQLPVHHAS
jgi:hypothetical protein